MGEGLRLRRHTDGRIALQVPTDRLAWSVVKGGGQGWVHEAEVHGQGWAELLVVPLPEPAEADADSGFSWIGSDGAQHTLYAYGPDRADLAAARADALNLLAAAAACEHYRAQHSQETP